ncbi:MAG: NifB/NifX family molybdenum-iron cluster-binding protein, partial [Lentisphaeria bacterium]|nr:NifB/NifX family molybdenum-iron cluster-binding protein [Lentisphaeria bacterium]
AFSLDGDQIAPTLGSSQQFLLLNENGTQEILPAVGNMAEILHQNQVTTLICSNIGNCMLEVLSQRRIKVIPGISGTIDEVLTLYRQNKLRPGKNFTCTENGCICGDCPGNY